MTDRAGNVTPATCKVEVVHDQSDDDAVDSGCAWCTGADCGSCPVTSPACP
ncbi:MAG TPA: hypothetical protein VM734_21805 [Kofleriaceae bacterium]|nr:hypothetical protein [Kofleriaceae bacterium]